MKEKIAEFFRKNKGITRAKIKFLLYLEAFIDKAINFLAIEESDGVHPKYRLTKYTDFFSSNVRDTDLVLDIGCGIGYVASEVSKKAKKITGVDIRKSNIDIAKTKFQKENLEFIIADATQFNFKDNYDAIILSNVLEHIKERVEFLKSIKHLAPKILIRVPMINRDWKVLYKKELGMTYMSDPEHTIEYTRDAFSQEMTEAGLEIESLSIQFGEIWSVIKVKLRK